MYNYPYHNADLSQYVFLVTGGAGFIGSNLVNYLMKYKAKRIIVLDNLSTGFYRNLLPYVCETSFDFVLGDITDGATCMRACQGVDFVLHHAALGSVPRSIHDPITTNNANVTGFLNMLVAAKDCGVKRMIYAASSSTYGDSKELPKKEDRIGKPISPYAVTKLVNELYADVFSRVYGMKAIGLRYFNVFGPNQDPSGDYAAVIPRFMAAITAGEAPTIHGDGTQTRDFTFVENVVQANIKALLSEQDPAYPVYNVAYNSRVSLNDLWSLLVSMEGIDPGVVYGPGRHGDIKDSLADISRIQNDLGYRPLFDVKAGLEVTYQWFKENCVKPKRNAYNNG